jgi:branched-chain amino acid transport system permease protein
MELLVQVIVYSVMLGGFYALMSQGLAISYGVLRFPNLAHGGLVICGAYTNWLLSGALGLDGLLVIPLTVAIGYPVGWLVASLLLVPLLEKTHFVQLLVSLGLALFIESSLILAFSAQAARIESPLSDYVFRYGWLNIRGTQLLMLGSSIVLIGILVAVLRWSQFGKMMRATSDDIQAAVVVGLPVRSVFTRSFAIGTMICFAAGAIMGIDQAFVPGMGMLLTLKAFVIVVVGGYSKVTGTIVAALTLALIEIATATYVPGIGSGVGIIAGVVLLAVMLWLKPEGLLNKATERAQAA